MTVTRREPVERCPGCDSIKLYIKSEEYETGVFTNVIHCNECDCAWSPFGEENKLNSKLLHKRNDQLKTRDQAIKLAREALFDAECDTAVCSKITKFANKPCRRCYALDVLDNLLKGQK